MDGGIGLFIDFSTIFTRIFLVDEMAQSGEYSRNSRLLGFSRIYYRMLILEANVIAKDC